MRAYVLSAIIFSACTYTILTSQHSGRSHELAHAMLASFRGRDFQPPSLRTDWQRRIADRLDRQDYSTHAPLIGVLTQPHTSSPPRRSHHHHHHDRDDQPLQSISGPLVSWIESAGGRVVPIPYNAHWDEIDEIFKSLNGLVLPGGSGELWWGHPFFDTAAGLLELAMRVNDKGDVFPVFGICLGFEAMHITLANRTREELLVPSTGQESTANALQFSAAAMESLFFRRWPGSLLLEMGRTELEPTFNAHEWAVPPSAYVDFPALADQLTVLTMSTDTAGDDYVSTVEHRHYPFFGTQWHPEKPPYEFADGSIPHTRTAISAAALTAQLLVDIARLSSTQGVPYDRQVKLVIDNYERHFLPAEEDQGPSDDPLPDTLWIVQPPKHARPDPERPDIDETHLVERKRIEDLDDDNKYSSIDNTNSDSKVTNDVQRVIGDESVTISAERLGRKGGPWVVLRAWR